MGAKGKSWDDLGPNQKDSRGHRDWQGANIFNITQNFLQGSLRETKGTPSRGINAGTQSFEFKRDRKIRELPTEVESCYNRFMQPRGSIVQFCAGEDALVYVARFV